MNRQKIRNIAIAFSVILLLFGCSIPKQTAINERIDLPASYDQSLDTTSISLLDWKLFFNDKYLETLIDTALQNNQELLMTLQEIEIARNDIRVRKGEILPSIGIGSSAGMDKVGRYTSQGAGDASTEIEPGKEMPEVLGNYDLGLFANWEVDIWKKLRNARKAAVSRYLATVDGKNFVVTNLVSEVANTYYELLALDNQLEIVQGTVTLQENALKIVKVQKEAARATELAVQKFQAEVRNSQGREYDILQKIKEAENKINFLLGRYPQPILRDKETLMAQLPKEVKLGIPSQLLERRADVRKAENELIAAKLDVKVARAAFYPKLDIAATLGLEAFRPDYLAKLPESVFFSLAGDMMAPLINKNAIKAEFYSADARQLQAMYNYQKIVLNAYLEVANQMSNLNNLEQKYDNKFQEVEALKKSISIANDLFKSARADYLEVLMTQRDALNSRLELIETKQKELSAVTNIYRALGGGWK